MSHIDYTLQYGEDEEPKEVRIYAFPYRITKALSQPRDLDEGDFAEME